MFRLVILFDEITIKSPPWYQSDLVLAKNVTVSILTKAFYGVHLSHRWPRERKRWCGIKWSAQGSSAINGAFIGGICKQLHGSISSCAVL